MAVSGPRTPWEGPERPWEGPERPWEGPERPSEALHSPPEPSRAQNQWETALWTVQSPWAKYGVRNRQSEPHIPS